MPQSKTYKIGISGHRKLANPEYVRKAIHKFLSKQQKLHPEIICISALAEGVDTIFAEEALKLDIPIEAILPFPEKDYQTTFSDQEKIDKLYELLLKATNITQILDEKPLDQDERRRGYLNCGTAIVDQSDFMLLVFDGKPASGTGGTGDIYEYCKEKNVKNDHVMTYKDNQHRIDTLKGLKNQKSAKAAELKRRHNHNWGITVSLGMLAAMLFAMNLSFGFVNQNQTLKLILGGLEVGCLVLGIISFFINENSTLKLERLANRREAELLRYVLKFVNAGIPLKALDTVSLSNNYIYDSDKKKEPIDRIVLRNNASIDTETQKEEIFYLGKDVHRVLLEAEENNHHIKKIKEQKESLMDLLTNPDKQIGQIAYHQGRIKDKTLHILENAQKTLLFFFVLLAIFTYSIEIINLNIPNIIHEWCRFLSLILLPIVATIEAIIYFNEYKRDKKESIAMLPYMKKWVEELTVATSRNDIERIATAIRRRMDEENLNWSISMDANANSKF